MQTVNSIIKNHKMTILSLNMRMFFKSMQMYRKRMCPNFLYAKISQLYTIAHDLIS